MMPDPGTSGGHRGRTALMLSSVLVLTLLAAGCFGPERDESGQVREPSVMGVADVRVGDCYDDESDALAAVYTTLPVVPCREPHDNEVYAIVEHPAASDAPYPGGAEVQHFAEEACYEAFGAYVGLAYEESALDFGMITPLADGWERAGDREVACFLYDLELEQLIGSMRGSGR